MQLYVMFAPKRAANVAVFDAHGMENAWKLLGSMVGLVIAWRLDERQPCGACDPVFPDGDRRRGNLADDVWILCKAWKSVR